MYIAQRIFEDAIKKHFNLSDHEISFFFMIFKASVLIQLTNIKQLCIDHFVR